jgi:hypothetical protein
MRQEAGYSSQLVRTQWRRENLPCRESIPPLSRKVTSLMQFQIYIYIYTWSLPARLVLLISVIITHVCGFLLQNKLSDNTWHTLNCYVRCNGRHATSTRCVLRFNRFMVKYQFKLGYGQGRTRSLYKSLETYVFSPCLTTKPHTKGKDAPLPFINQHGAKNPQGVKLLLRAFLPSSPDGCMVRFTPVVPIRQAG